MKAKVKYTECAGARVFLKETKKHWWSRWEVERFGGIMPILYFYENGNFIPAKDNWEKWRYIVL